MAGQSSVRCDLCHRAPGDPHLIQCARSRHQQDRLGAQLESASAPRWVFVATMVVSDREIVGLGEHSLPENGPRSDVIGVAY